MSEPVFKFSKAFIAQADRAGQKFGEKLPERLERFMAFVAKKFKLSEDLSELPPAFYAFLPKLIELLATTGEVPREVIPIPGFIGDVIHENVNEFIDGVGRGATDKKDGGKKTTTEPKKLDPAPVAPPAPTKVDEERNLVAYLKLYQEDLLKSVRTAEDVETVPRRVREIHAKLDADHALKEKMVEAFTGRHAYENFVYVVTRPNSEWHNLCDFLLGKATSPSSLKKKIEDKVEKEIEETKRAVDALLDNGTKVADGLAAFNDRNAARIAKRREELEALKAKRANGKLAKTIVTWSLTIMVIAVLLVLNLK